MEIYRRLSRVVRIFSWNPRTAPSAAIMSLNFTLRDRILLLLFCIYRPLYRGADYVANDISDGIPLSFAVSQHVVGVLFQRKKNEKKSAKKWVNATHTLAHWALTPKGRVDESRKCQRGNLRHRLLVTSDKFVLNNDTGKKHTEFNYSRILQRFAAFTCERIADASIKVRDENGTDLFSTFLFAVNAD